VWHCGVCRRRPRRPAGAGNSWCGLNRMKIKTRGFCMGGKGGIWERAFTMPLQKRGRWQALTSHTSYGRYCFLML
jgi:hypothetical protein